MADFQKDGWCYDDPPSDGGDARKLVTLEQDGMEWVGIRIWHAPKGASRTAEGQWMNNNEPCPHETVKAWRELPTTAKGFYDRGQLTVLTNGR